MTCRPDGRKHAALPGQPHEISNGATTSETTATAATPWPDTSRAAFYGDALGVRDARRWVAEHVDGHRRADMATVTGELCSNAAAHTASAAGRFTVILQPDSSGVAVVVRDGGSTRSVPHVADVPADDEHGRGLAVVAGLSDEWGTADRPDGRDVWAWFDGAAVRHGER